MQKPSGLKKGDTIGIIAPSSPVIHKTVEKAQSQLEEWGYSVKLGESCYQKKGYLSGDDYIRARDINLFFQDQEIKGIICLRGGYGATRLLSSLNYNTIKNNPKIFVGFSDITALHIVFNQYCQLVTFHGPMAANIANKLDPFTENSLLATISNHGEIGSLKNPEGEGLFPLVAGEARGKLIGGNLTVITSTLGTPYEINSTNRILFLEEVGEEPYRIDRMLTQLILAGKLQKASGIILGNFNDCEGKNPNDTMGLIEVLQERIAPLGIPTLYGLKAGHCTPQVTIPFGLETYINPTRGIIRIEESGISQ